MVSAFLRFLQFLLGLAEFGQVEGGDFFGFFDLVFVCLDLLLKFVNEILHSLVVLLILVALEGKFLDAALAFPQVLLGIGVAASFVVKLRLEFADAAFQFRDGLLAVSQGVVLNLLEADLEFLHLDFETLAEFLLVLGVLLLGAELVGETGSVNHGLLCLLFGILGFVEHLIEVSLEMKAKID